MTADAAALIKAAWMVKALGAAEDLADLAPAGHADGFREALLLLVEIYGELHGSAFREALAGLTAAALPRFAGSLVEDLAHELHQAAAAVPRPALRVVGGLH